MLTVQKNERYLVHFMFSVSVKNTPNSLQNFKSQRVRVAEIMGGGGSWLNPPLSIRCGYQTSQYRKGIKWDIFNSMGTVLIIVGTMAISYS